MKVNIPFEVIELEKRSYHILVKCSIKKQEYYFVIDTGASKSLIDIDVARDLKRKHPNGDSPVATGIMAEKISVEFVSIPQMSIGKYKFKKVEAVVTDLKAINEVYNKITGKKIGGLIGCDFLFDKGCKIDFKKKVIIIKKAKTVAKS